MVLGAGKDDNNVVYREQERKTIHSQTLPMSEIREPGVSFGHPSHDSQTSDASSLLTVTPQEICSMSRLNSSRAHELIVTGAA